MVASYHTVKRIDELLKPCGWAMLVDTLSAADNCKNEKTLTIKMLIKSANAGRWLHD